MYEHPIQCNCDDGHGKRTPMAPETRSCPTCCKETQGEANFCAGCGAQLSWPSNPSRARDGGTGSTVPPTNRPVPDMPKPDAPTPPPPSTALCTRCQVPLVAGAVFCHVCGHREGPQPKELKLVCRSRNGTQQAVAMGSSELVVGSAPDCGIVVANDAFVSRRHVRVTTKDGRVQAEDLGSSNGTLLRLRQPSILEPGDELVIGTTVLRLELAGQCTP